MSYSLLFDSKHTATPFGMWQERGKPEDVEFVYSQHNMDDVLRIIYEPAQQLVFITVDLEYYDIMAALQISVDEQRKHVVIDGAVCDTYDMWPLINGGGAPPSKVGGIRHFKKVFKWISLPVIRLFVTKMFGKEYEWSYLKNSKEVSASLIGQCKEYRMDAWERGPWDKVAATYWV